MWKGVLWTLIGGVVLFLVPVYFAFLLSIEDRGLSFKPVDFAALSGFEADDLAGFDQALAQSCKALVKMPLEKLIGPETLGARAGDWVQACQALEQGALPIRDLIQSYFQPYEVRARGSALGQFTGYYEPLLKGSMDAVGPYQTPLYGVPEDLIQADLGQFRTDLSGVRLRGKVKDGRFTPYEDRGAIRTGGLAGRAEPLVYIKDPVDAFFLHIQGSGRVELPDGRRLSVGYAGQNGHPYYAIGRTLRDAGHIAPEHLSLQSIRQWLNENPDEAHRVMDDNPSFIFFRFLEEGLPGPLGSAGVPLIARRALAVDRRHLPLHAPIFVATEQPDPSGGIDMPFKRLLMAQDTGGAINGEIRGDIFFGFGPEAEYQAGHMNAAGRYWLLLPKAAASRLES